MDNLHSITDKSGDNTAYHPRPGEHAYDKKDIDGDCRLVHLVLDAVLYLAPFHSTECHTKDDTYRRGSKKGYL